MLKNINDLNQILLFHDIDVEVITETWSHDGVWKDEVIPHSYNILRRDKGANDVGVA